MENHSQMYSLNQWAWMNFFSEFIQRIQTIHQICLTQMQPEEAIADWQPIFELFQEVIKKAIFNPQAAIQSHLAYSEGSLSLFQSLIQGQGENRFDKRFKEDIWQTHPLYRGIYQHYLLICDYIDQQILQLEGLEAAQEKKLRFYMKQFLDAVSPANFHMTNPQVLESIFQSQGSNILKGLDHFIEDLKRNPGKFHVSITDADSFEIGKDVAVTKGKIVYQNDLMQLIQYNAQTKEVYQNPLLIIPPWINKYYILDLSAHNSLVNWLVNAGYTVFMISWVNPDKSLSHKHFENYMLEGPIAALKIISEITGEPEVNAVGYCIGGTLLACTLSYLADKKESPIKSGTYLTTLLDFSEPGDLGVFMDEKQIQLLEKKMEKDGFLDGRSMARLFNSLRANDLIWSYYVKHYLKGESPASMDILYWNADSTHLPHAAHQFYLRNMYLYNHLILEGGIKLAGTPIHLKSIQLPVYFFSAEQDHIVPWKSTYAGIHLHSGPSTFVLGGSGHVAGVINPPQSHKYYYYTCARKYKNPESFMKNARRKEGSWWIHWEKWLRRYAGEKISAEKVLLTNKLKPLEDAPGMYVKKRI